MSRENRESESKEVKFRKKDLGACVKSLEKAAKEIDPIIVKTEKAKWVSHKTMLFKFDDSCILLPNRGIEGVFDG